MKVHFKSCVSKNNSKFLLNPGVLNSSSWSNISGTDHFIIVSAMCKNIFSRNSISVNSSLTRQQIKYFISSGEKCPLRVKSWYVFIQLMWDKDAFSYKNFCEGHRNKTSLRHSEGVLAMFLHCLQTEESLVRDAASRYSKIWSKISSKNTAIAKEQCLHLQNKIARHFAFHHRRVNSFDLFRHEACSCLLRHNRKWISSQGKWCYRKQF